MRETKTGFEIQVELTRVIHEALACQGLKDDIRVGLAVLKREPDAAGCNWYVDYFQNARPHMPLVAAALKDVKGRLNLAVPGLNTNN